LHLNGQGWVDHQQTDHFKRFIDTTLPRLEKARKAFAPDVVLRFADFPEMHGLEEPRRFLAARFERQKNYRLQKQLRAIWQDVLVRSWDATRGWSRRPIDGRSRRGTHDHTR
jgi:hypothetical protein